MENSVRARKYWLKIMPVLAWQVLYLVFCNSFGKYTRVYCDLVFYFGIVVYFALWRSWSFSGWWQAAKRGKSFWLAVFLTAAGLAAMFGIGFGLSALFPDAGTGMGVFGVNNWPTLIAFALVTVFLPPVAEEVFYRGAVTAFDTKTIMLMTTIISILLYASEHSLAPLGFLQACLWAIPLSIAYIKTRSIYICMTAHLICNLIFNGITVVLTGAQLMS